MKAVVALLAALCLASATIYKGVDVSYYSGTVSQSAFSCMKSANYEFVVIEAWVERHSCPTFTQTYKNAIAAGIPQVDAYAFICNSCMGGSGNVETIVNGLKSVLPSGFNGRIWLDIEYASGIWSGSGSSNLAFAKSVANALTSAGYNLGIYTNYNNWQQIMGSAGPNPFSNLPLWYPRYDNNPNPAVGITSFGGWNGCTIKQYNENIKVCGINTDVNVATTLFPNNQNSSPSNNESGNKEGGNKESGNNEEGNKENGENNEQGQAESNNEESKTSAQAGNPNASKSSSNNSNNGSSNNSNNGSSNNSNNGSSNNSEESSNNSNNESSNNSNNGSSNNGSSNNSNGSSNNGSSNNSNSGSSSKKSSSSNN